MIFRQLFDPTSATYTYIIGCSKTKNAVIVDPVLEQVERDLKFVAELDLNLNFTLETHIHADHITGASLIKARTGAMITVPNDPHVTGSDKILQDREILTVGDINIDILGMSGHTGYDFCYYINKSILLTGDILFIRGCGRTDFQAGNANHLYDNVTKRLFTLPHETAVYPAHDYNGCTSSTIGEEKQYNTRLANKSREDFIAIMTGLNLPKPKRIDEALPRNRHCGLET